jgi:hypothetical protein
MCHYTFTTAEDFLAAFMPHAAVLQADIANYTTIAPVVQFSVVEIAEPVERPVSVCPRLDIGRCDEPR